MAAPRCPKGNLQQQNGGREVKQARQLTGSFQRGIKGSTSWKKSNAT